MIGRLYGEVEGHELDNQLQTQESGSDVTVDSTLKGSLRKCGVTMSLIVLTPRGAASDWI